MNGADMLGPGLLVATLATPLVLVLACLWRRLRDSMQALLVLAPLPGLAAAILAIGGTSLAFDQPQLGISLALDVPGAILLGVAALLWSGAGVYAFTDLRGKANSARFAVCWLLTLAGSLGVFMAADLLGYYLAALENEQCGDAANAVAHGCLAVVVDVQLANLCSTGEFVGNGVDGRPHHFARSAPRSPELNQHGERGVAG